MTHLMTQKKFPRVEAWGVTVVSPMKVGRSTILHAVKSLDHTMHAFYAIKGDVIMVVRHPLDRFKSLWRNKCRDGGRVKGRQLEGLTPEGLFDVILRDLPNSHWVSQRDFYDNIPTRCSIKVVRLENLQQYIATPLPKLLNVTTGDVPMSTQLERAVTKHYAADVRLYEDAL